MQPIYVKTKKCHFNRFIIICLLESISEKDKRRLQNVMAYGEDGKMIEDAPRQRRPPPGEREQEKEVDRFDEGKVWANK